MNAERLRWYIFHGVRFGRAHVEALREVCGQFQAAHPDARILAFPEYEVVLDESVSGDYAGAYETSLMMHYYPDTVDLE
ncbi:MAG: hypothetical protein DRP95_06735 [Candidatus Latescibacterota bacterium]|nr:MAG: hypothetical protein DRP95_06735 [Candidatus Latescibacterota bacterium]